MTDHNNCTDENCEHDHGEEQVIYIMFDGEDEEVACDVLGIFDVEGKEYIAITPKDSDDDVLLYGFQEDEEGEVDLTEIETDEEYEKVASTFEQEFFDLEEGEEVDED